ncbi:MAG TPA: DUF4287 domain-containing protein [Caulobacteraceae bacterium]|jgi:hypothetical protein|nr:DUF4287 domain-containing protein [Caulobacteraceae bacterium]
MPEPSPPPPHLTERQRKYFASLQASLERDTGRTLADWVAIARTCPENGHRARLKWLKDNHGLLQNHGSHVLSEAFESAMSWQEPEKLLGALWVDPASTAIFRAADAAARAPGEVIQGPRKGYTAWSRNFQFAAAKPLKGGKLMLGLALAPDADARLEPPKNEGWSERLKARTLLSSPAEVDAEIKALLKAAWERS